MSVASCAGMECMRSPRCEEKGSCGEASGVFPHACANLKVVSKVVDRSKTELIEGCVRELLVVHHELVLVVQAVCQVEE